MKLKDHLRHAIVVNTVQLAIGSIAERIRGANRRVVPDLTIREATEIVTELDEVNRQLLQLGLAIGQRN